MRPLLKPAPPGLLPPRLPASNEHWINVAGRRTRFFRFGQGPPLLLIPSAFLRAASYRGTIGGLARRFEVLAAEMPGSGRSQRLRRA
jgi:hypothetical protein